MRHVSEHRAGDSASERFAPRLYLRTKSNVAPEKLALAQPAAEEVHALGQQCHRGFHVPGSHQLARLKARLTECYRLEQSEIAEGRSQMETLATQVSQQHEQVMGRKRELERWLRECEADVEAAAARLADRERLLDQQRDTLEKQRFDWEHERQEYQHEIRRLLAELGQQLLHDVAKHVGQPERPALELVRQPGVVEAQAVQDRRLQVVDVDLVLDGVIAELVGRAVA